MAPEPNPRLVFERLFGAGKPGERQANLQRRRQEDQSILDFVLDDARAMQKRLGRPRQAASSTSTSPASARSRRASRRPSSSATRRTRPSRRPPGIPADYDEHVQLMYDMLVLAFQTDSTRVATFLLAHDGSNRSFDQIGISEGHHDLTHHQNRKDWIDKVAEIDLWYIQQFARFLEKLEATKDVDGKSLLHNSMIVYGSGNADGNRHTHANLPMILAGGGGGAPDAGPLRQARLASR